MLWTAGWTIEALWHESGLCEIVSESISTVFLTLNDESMNRVNPSQGIQLQLYVSTEDTVNSLLGCTARRKNLLCIRMVGLWTQTRFSFVYSGQQNQQKMYFLKFTISPKFLIGTAYVKL